MKFVVLKKERHKDRLVKEGQTDSIKELLDEGWTTTRSTKKAKKRSKKK